MRLAAGTVLCGGAAFGGLLWWQLQAFDRMTDSRLERGMGLFALELERRDGGLLQRDLVLRLGFRTEDGLTESFLVMNGCFRPGLRPSVSFEPVANSDPDAAILVKADPRIRFVFSPLMSPEEAEVVWRGAADEKATISTFGTSTSTIRSCRFSTCGLMPACTRLRMSGCRASQRISYLARIWRTCPASVPTAA